MTAHFFHDGGVGNSAPHPAAFKKILKSFPCTYSSVSSTVFTEVMETRDFWELQFPKSELV